MLSGDINIIIFPVLTKNAILGLLPESTMTRRKEAKLGIPSSPLYLINFKPPVPDSPKAPRP